MKKWAEFRTSALSHVAFPSDTSSRRWFYSNGCDKEQHQATVSVHQVTQVAVPTSKG